jgi:DNA-binding NarL/FixJ family response regulator/tRNA A-37 threonylcarbamoyl transferase component Bud32
MNGQPTSGTYMEPPLRLQNRYRLVECIGEGSMGMVYRAYDDTLGRDVAIKFLRPGRIASEASSARFLREARAVARLSHPNIMTLYDVGQEGEWHYLVLQYVPGCNLHDRMLERGGPLAVREAMHAICGALEALAYAHARGIVHRDIKPENIMLTPDGQVTVTDFGLALARGDVRLTQEGMIVGTVLYLAPEVISGTPPDRRADLYAIGAVLYELLVGRPPFAGDDPLIVFSQVLNTPVTAPRTLNEDVPPEVERVVLKLLAKVPNERYASAEEALADLTAAAPDAAMRADPLRTTPPQATPEMPASNNAPAAGQAIRILLVDDQALFRAGLHTLLSVQPDFQIVGEAGNGQQALYVAEQLCPDIVLMDLRMPVLDGVATTRRLHTIRPDSKVIVLTTFDDDEYIFDALRAGALGYLLKDAAPEVLYSAIRAAARGESVLQPSVAAKVVSQFARLAEHAPEPSLDLVEPLSEREVEVLRVIAQGKTNKEIAAELYIAEGTVKNHVTNILGKLGVHDRTQAALKARDMGLI